jgi:ribosomal protein L11 methyltransferase
VFGGGKHMKWLEIKIITTEEASDAVSEMLTTIGAGGVAIEDPNEIRREIMKPNSLDYADDDFLENLGSDVTVKSYFQGDMNITELVELVKEKINFISKFLDIGQGYAGYSEVDDEDWATAWKKYYKPIHISDRVVIKPSWEEYEIKDNEVVIELDPGMAFGTGTHETTRMCAQLLEKYIANGDKVIDVGCGTGILSIIASKLGAESITAIDIDEVAVRVTKENYELNGVENINSFRGVLEDIARGQVDIVLANIIANVIIDISKDIPYYVKADGYFITSGIIKERKQEVLDSYLKLGFTCEETLEIGEWVAMVFKCQNSL